MQIHTFIVHVSLPVSMRQEFGERDVSAVQPPALYGQYALQRCRIGKVSVEATTRPHVLICDVHDHCVRYEECASGMAQ